MSGVLPDFILFLGFQLHKKYAGRPAEEIRGET